MINIPVLTNRIDSCRNMCDTILLICNQQNPNGYDHLLHTQIENLYESIQDITNDYCVDRSY